MNTTVEKVKMIIDTDPGVDDAMAITYAALNPNIELLGLTTVFGNVSTEQSTINACLLSDWSGQSIPVIEGCRQPWLQDIRDFPDFVHGKNGFGDIAVNAPSCEPVANVKAAQWIVDTVRQHPHEITLVAIGPLTNIALALMLEPEIVSLVDRVMVMGGACRRIGNVSPVAEANFRSDPHAADVVMKADWRVDLAGLDITQKIKLSRSQLTELDGIKHEMVQYLVKMTHYYMNFYSRALGVKEDEGEEGFCVMHDPTAVIAAEVPDWFEGQSAHIRVETSGLAIGQSMCHYGELQYFNDVWDQTLKHHVLQAPKSGQDISRHWLEVIRQNAN